MKVAVFSTKQYDRQFLEAANVDHNHELVFLKPQLSERTASLAEGFQAACLFVSDTANARTLATLASNGTRLLALRSAGFNHVDLNAAADVGIKVVRVPAYSPYAVAEHAVGLILMLNRKLYRAYNRVRDDNFALNGLLGFDIHGKTVGVIGTGKIGQCFTQIMKGFGCKLLAYDVYHSPVCLKMGVEYVELADLLAQSDIISLHCPLLPATQHLINRDSLKLVKPGTMLINTSRGGLVDTQAVIEALKSGQVGYFGTDVYEEEESLFFEDLSDEVIQDDTFQLLQSFPNVVITAHQAFFTEDALSNIARTTLLNISDVESGQPCDNQIISS